MEHNSQDSQPPHPPPAYEVEAPTDAPTIDSPPVASPAASPAASPPTGTQDDTDPTPTHILTFHHTSCPLCSTTTLFEHVITTANFFDLQCQMTARVYDLFDIMHPDDPGVVDGPVRLSLVKCVEPEELHSLEDMDYRERVTLLNVLAEGGHSYRLRLEFETMGMMVGRSGQEDVMDQEEKAVSGTKEDEPAATEPEHDIYSAS